MAKGGRHIARILGFDYEVRTVSDQDELRAAGDSRPGRLVIRVAMDQNEQQQTSTLLHEIIHMIMFHMMIDQDEQLAGKLETGFYAFLVDNGFDLTPLKKMLHD